MEGPSAVGGAVAEDAGSRSWPAPCLCWDAIRGDRIPRARLCHAGNALRPYLDKHADEAEIMRDNRQRIASQQRKSRQHRR